MEFSVGHGHVPCMHRHVERAVDLLILVLLVFRDAATGRVTPHEEEGGVGVNTEKKTSHRYYLLPPYFTITGFVTRFSNQLDLMRVTRSARKASLRGV